MRSRSYPGARHTESHRTSRIGWLRAAVLGANDGIVSTGSLMLGVAAAQANHSSILVTGVAGLVAGAMSMAAGEYVSVHSQADTEKADLARERTELDSDPVAEHRELAAMYVARGLDTELAAKVAEQLMAHDALAAHAQDELGISGAFRANPIQAALASAASFACGAAVPLIVAGVVSERYLKSSIAIASLVFLVCLGVLSARLGGANMWGAAARVSVWGALAMTVTAAAGHLFGATP